jgi:hypothetical protein
MPHSTISRSALKLLPGLSLLALLSMPRVAEARSVIKQPGNHPDYSVEIEPHFVFQWANRFGDDDGFGPGVRVNIPFLDNGPIKTINNNMAIGVGLDITFGDNDCRWWWNRHERDEWLDHEDCSVTEVWLPVTLQWNFFLTDVISVFGEPGFAISHRRWDWDWYCERGSGALCDYDDSDTGLDFVFWGGARFMFSDTIGATVRIGSPYVSVGVNFLL